MLIAERAGFKPFCGFIYKTFRVNIYIKGNIKGFLLNKIHHVGGKVDP